MLFYTPLLFVVLSLPFGFLAASQMELTAKIGTTGHMKLIKLTIEITTGAATTRVTAPAAVLDMCDCVTIIYNTTERCITINCEP